ncbi:MAG: hypothetical protein ABH836_00885 [Candidatus Omnitrophota bacterium]
MSYKNKPRQNWAQAFKRMAEHKDDTLLIDNALDIDIKEWIW